MQAQINFRETSIMKINAKVKTNAIIKIKLTHSDGFLTFFFLREEMMNTNAVNKVIIKTSKALKRNSLTLNTN